MTSILRPDGTDPTDDYLSQMEKKLAQKKRREAVMRELGQADDPEKIAEYARKQELDRWRIGDRTELLRKYDGPPPGAYWTQAEEDAYRLSKEKKAEEQEFARKMRQFEMDKKLARQKKNADYMERNWVTGNEGP